MSKRRSQRRGEARAGARETGHTTSAAPPTSSAAGDDAIAPYWHSAIMGLLMQANDREHEHILTLDAVRLRERVLGTAPDGADPRQVELLRREIAALKRVASTRAEESKTMRELADYAKESAALERRTE
jgi:hypothetical protein